MKQHESSPTQDRNMNQIERQASPFTKLRTVMSRNAQEINNELLEMHGLSGLVDDTLHINPAAYTQEKGGIYSQVEIKEDLGFVDSLDRTNSAADIENTQKFYKDTYGIDTPEGIVAKHRETKESSKSNQAEMAITALMHKVLKDRFLVVRTSTYDDYKHGADNLILDKQTGAVICAFDEVLENEGDKERGASKKIEKIKKSASKGGTKVKYGVSLVENKIVRAPSKSVPVFYLALESKDLSSLTNDLYYNQADTLSELESRIFAHLVTSIKEQKAMLESLQLPHQIVKKLDEFNESLSVLEEYTKR